MFVAEVQFCNWYFETIYNAEVDTISYFTDDKWIRTKTGAAQQIMLRLMYNVSVFDVKFVLCAAVRVTVIIGSSLCAPLIK